MGFGKYLELGGEAIDGPVRIMSAYVLPYPPIQSSYIITLLITLSKTQPITLPRRPIRAPGSRSALLHLRPLPALQAQPTPRQRSAGRQDREERRKGVRTCRVGGAQMVDAQLGGRPGGRVRACVDGADVQDIAREILVR
jgi:hypothetical protein